MSKYRQATLDEKRAMLKLKPPPWEYDESTGALTSAKHGTSITQFVYNGVYLNPRCIRVFLATGFYPEEASLKPAVPDLRLNMIEYDTELD